jgi:hypothetical protein
MDVHLPLVRTIGGGGSPPPPRQAAIRLGLGVFTIDQDPGWMGAFWVDSTHVRGRSFYLFLAPLGFSI